MGFLELEGSLSLNFCFFVCSSTPRIAIDKKLLKNVVNGLGGQVTNQTPSIRISSANPEMRATGTFLYGAQEFLQSLRSGTPTDGCNETEDGMGTT